MPKKKEADFQIELAMRFEKHGHLVALHDAGTASWGRRFSTDGLVPDLVVLTNKNWRYHEAFPVLAVEVKMGDDSHITETLDGVQKIFALYERKPRYFVSGKELSSSAFNLLATPSSVERGIVTTPQP